jgi:RNA polymerase sigma factor (sigma-70 family)
MSRSLLQLVIRHAESFSAPDADADSELLARFARTRDESAFAELLRRHGPMVWAVCRQSLPDAADAEDAFQAVFFALIRSPESVRGRNAVGGWLHGTAVRVVAKLKRTAVRRKQREARVAGPEADGSVPAGRWDALIAAVHEEVQRLPDALRTAFVMCELEGVRQPEAAEQLGCKAGTLTSRLTRARQLLIERLSGRGLAPAVLGTLGIGVATASAAPPQPLIDSTLLLVNAGEAVSPAILHLATQVTPMFTRTRLAAATLLLACGIGMAALPSHAVDSNETVTRELLVPEVVAVADDKPQLPVELQYVPADSALFVHIEAAKLWDSSLGKSLRTADPKIVEELAASTKKHLGHTLDQLKSASIFVPEMKKAPSVGIVLVFKAPYDPAKLKAALQVEFPESVTKTFLAPSDTVAVLLVGLDEKTFGKPQTTEGPLTATIREAASGKHLISAGSTLANLPDAAMNIMLPPDLKSVQTLLKSESLSAFLDLNKDLSLDVRVKSGDAVAVAKALGTISETAAEFLGQGLAKVDKNDSSAASTKVLEAVYKALKNVKPTSAGDTAKAVVAVPGDLPFGLAFLEGMGKARHAAARAQSTNNLKQIVLAMHNYHDANGAMPPAAVCDKNGKPLLSWRVLILPYIEQEALYKKFKLDEPWDSENNKPLIESFPKIYGNPMVKDQKPGETNYRVFVGNGAAFDWLKGPKLQDFKDGTSNTFLVVTAKDSVPWTKPDELAFDPDKDMTKLLGYYEDVCVTAFADGSVRAISKNAPKKMIHGLITHSGGEVNDLDK